MIWSPVHTRYLVWQDDWTGNNEIYVKTSLDGGSTWSGISRITYNNGNSRKPSLVAGPGDVVYVAWQDDQHGNDEIYAKSSHDGGATWSAIARITYNDGISRNPSIAVDSGGAVYLAWQDDWTGNSEIYIKMSADGGSTWSVATRITYNDGISQAPVLAAGPGGAVYLAWQDDWTGNSEIYIKKSADGGSTWSPVQRITYNAGNSRTPVLTVDSSGTVYLAWQDDQHGNDEIYVKSSSNGGASWSAVSRITYNDGISQNPSLAVDSGGAVYLAWQDDWTGNSEIYVKKSTDGGSTWGGASRITYNTGLSVSPSLYGGNGDLSIAWQDDQHGNNEIYVKTSPDGGATWSAMSRITYNNGNSGMHSLR